MAKKKKLSDYPLLPVRSRYDIVKSKVSISEKNFSIPATLWGLLGKPREVVLRQQGRNLAFFTLVTGEPGEQTIKLAGPRNRSTRHAGKLPIIYHGSKLIRRGYYEGFIEDFNGKPVLVIKDALQFDEST